ncbi:MULTISPECIES: lipopolysaccharide biosynthesis protein [unclassified Sphingomonas]|uniref:lipopolysaccharide biosynthesis protein n=1 Tax=unclassified Sphingomonas TaxID=196159 RepID=UPI00160B9C39|nr:MULTISPECIES: oligosaccharide flippase family protein [unclassified Sphingomonas]MBB3348219.1 O-antigen/teichoic acid export membrane protein [Sphingomonas sp. BK069]MBB3473700.1 O-antigen/teichoic acid export membrane protein [Sphingomonas sp. BK345]
MTAPDQPDDIAALAKGGRTNVAGFILKLGARIPFLFIAGHLYGAALVGRFAIAVVVVELAALVATLGLKRGLAQALSSAERPHNHVVFDALALALVASLIASAVLCAFPQAMYPNSAIGGLDRFFPLIILAPALSDVSLAALAYRHDVKASVTARAIVEPWTLSIFAFLFSFFTLKDGLVLAYVASMVAALTASIVPLLRSYGVPSGWSPHLSVLWQMARANTPLAGADALEWGSRNVDRLILGTLFAPNVVGIYYMAQQVASLPQRLKTSFDPILGPVVTRSIARGDLGAIARQVRQVAFWIIAAQLALALTASIPRKAVMATIGPQFTSGAAAMVFLLFAEVCASTGAVAESALVYLARHRNLLISATMLVIQIALSFAFILLIRDAGYGITEQAAGAPVALLLVLLLTSFVKARVLGRLLGAPVSPMRWPLLWAALAGGAVGGAFTLLPPGWRWMQVSVGVVATMGAYLFVIWRYAFGPEDRALFNKMPTAEEATLPNEGSFIR